MARHAPVHFMGIGGAGMSPLAELILRSGGRVTGCDMQLGTAAQRLHGMGVEVWEGHDPAHIEGCSALVVTAAAPPEHPEAGAARRLGLPVLKRARALGAIVNRGRVVGVSGTHGKTTTTTLTTAVLTAADLDPTGLVGAHVPAWGSNLRFGSDQLFVVEADEYDRSFLTLRPFIAVVTTLEADHLDIFGSLDAVEDAFLDFARAVPEQGAVIGCGDDSGVGRLLARLNGNGPRVVTYGTSAGSMVRAEEVDLGVSRTCFSVRERGRTLGTATIRAPGLHNVRNALAAVAVARELGAHWDAIAEGLAGYSGINRRFERVGEAGGVIVVDDYAHHPTEITATLAAAHDIYSDRRIVAVFQPHLYSRTRDFADAFGRALSSADLVFVTDVYPARECPIPGVSGERVAKACTATVRYIAERTRVPAAVAEELRAGDVCITLGAGDLDVAARDILAHLNGPSGA